MVLGRLRCQNYSPKKSGKEYLLSEKPTFCEYADTSLDCIVLGNSNSAPLSLLPDEIIDILNGDSADDITILQRYLRMFVELYNLQQPL